MASKEKILNQAVNFIAKEEGLRLNAYLCSAGVPTIGYGTTKMDGVPVKLGDKCTEEDAKKWLKRYIERDFIYINGLVKDTLN